MSESLHVVGRDPVGREAKKHYFVKKSQVFKHFGVLMAKNLFNQRNPRLMNYLPFFVSLWLKNPFNQRNLRLIKDLRACKALYICRDTFTNVMSALQIRLFMQNEAKFRKSQMNVNKVLTKAYEKKTLGERGKKQSQTNPNKAKFKKAKMNVTSIITKNYENKPPIRAPKKQTQISKRQKPMQTSLPQRIMKKTAFSGSGKTKPNKANFAYPQRLARNCAEADRKEVRCRIPEITCLWQLKFMAHSGKMPPVNRVREVSNRRRQIVDILGVKSMKRCSLLIVRDYSDGSFSRD